MLHLDVASTDQHFAQILSLQRRYHARTLPPDVQAQEGFVFAEHTVPLLRSMAAELPQAIALAGDEVVGYCLSLPFSLRAELPALAPMFGHFNLCHHRGRPLSDMPYFVGGQVCVDRAHRGQGLLARLYETVRRAAPPNYELCVTEIAQRNQVSIRAHERMGFEAISSYSDGGETWIVVAWDLARPARASEGFTGSPALT